MTKAKTVNYTPAQEKTLAERFEAAGKGITAADFDARDVVVKELAAEMKKDVRSVRSKLTNMGIYIPRSKGAKSTGETDKKEVIAERLVNAIGTIEIDGKEKSLNADSLAKCNKSDLNLLLHYFNSQIVDEVTEDEDENDSQEDETES